MTNTLFEAMKETDNETVTTNGMAAVKSTLSKVLDLFAKGASYRKRAEVIKPLVRAAYLEDKLLTIRCLFYLRDVRGGQGEREIFRKGIREVAELDTKTFINSNLISHIPTYGRWDDLLALLEVSDELDAHIVDFINTQLRADIENVMKYGRDANISILAKWLPSCNTSSKKSRRLAKKIYTTLGYTEKQYRKTLSKLRKQIGILETYLTNKDYTFDYNRVPSNANMKYRKCFYAKDGERYQKHIDLVTKTLDGDWCCMEVEEETAKVNVRTLYPYEIVQKVRHCDNSSEIQNYNNMWRSLPNYFGEDASKKNWLAVVDTSGSMTWTGPNPLPIDVAVSLGMYIAERNEGIFKNKFITFEEEPHLIEFDDKWNIAKKVQHIMDAPWGMNTNLISVFDLVLNSATKHNLPVEQMPEALVIISDMQFDQCVYESRNYRAYEIIKNKYEAAGYPVPKLVFWNASQQDYGNLPVTKHECGAVLVGGCQAGMFEQILSGKTPEDFMLLVLNGERYNSIALV